MPFNKLKKILHLLVNLKERTIFLYFFNIFCPLLYIGQSESSAFNYFVEMCSLSHKNKGK